MDPESSKNSECVKVVVRCRPPNKKEEQEGRQNIVSMNTETGFIEIINPEKEGHVKRFTFDAVYDQDSTQRMVYDETAFPLVESVLEGFNGTIFAYGQTGCGKTWTMIGSEDPDLRGIIPNSFEHIFNSIQLKNSNIEEENAGRKLEFLVRASYLEIYNEDIRDLLSDDPKKKLELKETPDKGVFVKELNFEVVEDRVQIDKVLSRGNANRTVGETLMNSVSSRSHSIFSVVIEVNEVDESGENHFRAGKLNLVDLAGSERQSKTGATGTRLKEGAQINLSLSALGNVISALVDGKGKHIPYRDSKLTRLLQDSLGGNTKTVMISAISPADYNFDETLSTLRYANRAKNIKNKPVINEDPKDALLREYKDEIENLKKLLEQQRLTGTPASGEFPVTANASPGERVVEKVVEKVVHVKDEKYVAENKALQDYSEAIVEQRNRLGEELDKKQQEIERHRREREELEEKLKQLQGKVLGKDDSTDDKKKERILEAKRQRDVRKAQMKLKEQKRKEAELLQAKEKAEDEKRLIEEEFKNAQGVAEAKQKALRALKKTMIAKMDRVKAEMRDMEEEFQVERESLLETIREQAREIKRLDQVLDIFLLPTERNKLFEQSEWNEDEGEWKLPKLRPRNGFKPLTLPGLNGEPPEGGAEVAESPSRKRRGSKEKQRKKKNQVMEDSDDAESVESKKERQRKEERRRRKKEREASQDVEDDASVQSSSREKRRTKSSRGRRKSKGVAVEEESSGGGALQWPLANLPSEDDGMHSSSMYGDRCQSRQGKRHPMASNAPPRQLAPLER